MNKEFLKKLLTTVSVCGSEGMNQRYAMEFARPFTEEQQIDAAGGMTAVFNVTSACRVLLSGHMDEIGFLVSCITESGMIKVQRSGGVRPKLYVGQPMQIMHSTWENGQPVRHKVDAVGVVSRDLLSKEKLEDSDLTLDIGASSKEEAEAVVSVGDPVCADTSVHELLNDRFSSRALDDKTGAFVVLEAARRAHEKGAKAGVYAHTSVGEETSGRGAFFAGANVRPSCAIVVDVTWANDCPGTDPASTGDVKVGAGPVLCHSGMTNRNMNRLLESIAREKNIPYQWEVAGGETYTDGDTIFRTGNGVPVALVSVPLRYMHSSVEVGSWKDLDNAAELISEFLLRIDEKFDYRPL